MNKQFIRFSRKVENNVIKCCVNSDQIEQLSKSFYGEGKLDTALILLKDSRIPIYSEEPFEEIASQLEAYQSDYITLQLLNVSMDLGYEVPASCRKYFERGLITFRIKEFSYMQEETDNVVRIFLANGNNFLVKETHAEILKKLGA